MLLSYFGVNLLLAISPGPDIIFVFTQSLQHNRKTGIVVTLGLCTGITVHIGLVLLGINALIFSSPTGFFILQSMGTLYLLYLGCNAYYAAYKNHKIFKSVDKTKTKTNFILAKFYLRGVILNVTNPKVLLFFLAILPQFIDYNQAQETIVLQTIILGMLSILATFICFGSTALLAGSFSAYLQRYDVLERIINLVAGSTFFLVAIYLYIGI